MADNESTSVTKDLGIVSAYGYAKAAGYTGTEEEFEEIFLEFTENAPGLLDRLDEAVEDAEAAQAAAEDAVTAAEAAQDAAEDAQAAAETAAATFETDTTLSVSGKAADAKVTGDKVTELSTAILDGNILLESGTFLDADGTTKKSNNARIRNKYPIPVEFISTIFIPDGYGIYAFLLDKDLQKITTLNWTNNVLQTLRGTDTKYINFSIRKNSATSADISSEVTSVQAGIKAFTSYMLSLNAIALPYPNVKLGGLKIDGSSVIVNADGFALTYGKKTYYIAPTDQTTVTTFNKLTGTTILSINLNNLTNVNARNNPADCMELHNPDGLTTAMLPVAICYKDNDAWHFCGAFRYYEDYEDSQNGRIALSGILAENQLIAHRKNSIADIETAIGNGYKVIEYDIRITSDNVAILSHDGTFTVDETTYTIAEETYADLVAVNPNLATLWDALLLCKKNNIVVDLDFTKVTTTEAINATYNCVTKLGMQGRCFITCVSSVARSFLAKSKNLCICVSAVNTTAVVDSVVDIAKTAMVSLCSTDSQYITAELVEYIHSKGFMSKPWTVNTVESIETLFGYGCDMVITDSVNPSDLT